MRSGIHRFHSSLLPTFHSPLPRASFKPVLTKKNTILPDAEYIPAVYRLCLTHPHWITNFPFEDTACGEGRQDTILFIPCSEPWVS